MPRAPKRCGKGGCEEFMPCATHPPANRFRPSTAGRGYGQAHRDERAEWQRRMVGGEVVHCRRGEKCLRHPDTRVDPWKPWHLGHPDAECSAPTAPEHMRCNTSAPSRLNARP